MTDKSLAVFFPPTGTRYVSEQLSGPETERLNTDAAPLSYFLRLVCWARMTGRSWTRTLLEGATRVRSWAPWAIGLAFCPLVLIRFFPTPARTSWWIAAQTGAVTMALQMLLIYYFQNRFGVIYRDIGLVSALYMAGLAGGGLAGRKILAAGIRPESLVPGLEAGLAALALAVALLVQGVVQIPVLALVFGVGLTSGTEFALLFPWHLSDPRRPDLETTLSRLEAADHGGAVLGALATGLILAPLVGLGITALAIGLLKTASGLAVWRTLGEK